MRIDDEVIGAVKRVAAETELPPAVLLAVAITETNGVAFAAVDGRREPLIRFEGHWFDRLLPEEGRRRARAAGLSAAKAGAVRNPASQAGRWRLLARASEIDPGAAYAATSWGLGQVMGLHWKPLGFAGPEALAQEARRSVAGQLRILAKFLHLGGLGRHLAERRFADFARHYNGPGYAAAGYDKTIAANYAVALGLLAERRGSDLRPPLSPGALPAANSAGGPPREPHAPTGAWSGRRAVLGRFLSWLTLRRSTWMPTRSSSTSTVPSSTSPTIPQPSGSKPTRSRG